MSIFDLMSLSGKAHLLLLADTCTQSSCSKQFGAGMSSMQKQSAILYAIIRLNSMRIGLSDLINPL